MNATLPPPPLPAAAAVRSRVVARPRSVPLQRLVGLARLLKSWLLAAISCLSIPLAIVFSGWTYRLVQRRALARWAGALGSRTLPRQQLPRWIVSDRFRADLSRASRGPLSDRIAALLRALFGSLAANLGTGSLVVLNSMLLTLPGGVIMLFSWYAGWNNSFHKLYEQAAVGPLWGLAGIFLFVAAMTYVPIAQARQAVTGSAKAFWNFRKVRDVIGRRPVACLGLTAGYALLGFVFMIAVSALQFIGNGDGFAEMTAPQMIAFLNSYSFWWAVLFIAPGFVLLKLFAGHLYASAVLEAVTAVEWAESDLCGQEIEALAAAPVRPAPPLRPILLRTGLRGFSLLGRATLRAAALVLLLAFASELYVAQFFNFDPAANWLRQPMVQIPWFRSIPTELQP